MKKTNIVRGGKKCGSIKFYKKNRVAPRVYISFNICIYIYFLSLQKVFFYIYFYKKYFLHRNTFTLGEEGQKERDKE